MNNLIVHQVNIAHDRLIELTKLADQLFLIRLRVLEQPESSLVSYSENLSGLN